MPPEFPTVGLDNVDGVPYTDVVGLRKGWGSFWQGKPGNALRAAKGPECHQSGSWGCGESNR